MPICTSTSRRKKKAAAFPANRQKAGTRNRRVPAFLMMSTIQAFTTFCGAPAKKAFRFSTAMSISRWRLSFGAQAMCGVTRQFS